MNKKIIRIVNLYVYIRIYSRAIRLLISRMSQSASDIPNASHLWMEAPKGSSFDDDSVEQSPRQSPRFQHNFMDKYPRQFIPRSSHDFIQISPRQSPRSFDDFAEISPRQFSPRSQADFVSLSNSQQKQNKNIRELIDIITQLTQLQEKIKLVNADILEYTLLESALMKIDAGIKDMEVCISGLISEKTKRVNQSKISPNIDIVDYNVVPIHLQRRLSGLQKRKQCRIKTGLELEKMSTDTSLTADSIKRRHTDNIIRYNK